MVTARYLDDKMMILIKQGQGFFHIGCSGHEAAQVAAASCLLPGKDWALPYYRDGAFTLQWGMTTREQLQSFLFRETDQMSGGRQMPQHYSSLDLRIPTQSSPTGTQYLQAVGIALGNKLAGKPDIVYTSSGEGTTSQGDFHEALNWASRGQLGVIFHIQDNEYAISTHISEQTAGASVYKISAGYEALERFDPLGREMKPDIARRCKLVTKAIQKTLDSLPAPSDAERACRVCGCTESTPCDGGCSWVEYDLCSACAATSAAFKSKSKKKRPAKGRNSE